MSKNNNKPTWKVTWKAMWKAMWKATTPSLHLSGPFRLNRKTLVGCLAIGVLLGACVYASSVRYGFSRTEEAVQNTRPLQHAFEKDPAFGVDLHDHDRMTQETLLRLAKTYRLVPSDAVIDEGKLPAQLVRLQAAHQIATGNGIPICAPGPGVLFLLSAHHGKSELVRDPTSAVPPASECDWQHSRHEEAARQHLAMVMSGQPGALERWRHCLDKDGTSDQEVGDECMQPAKHRRGLLQYLIPWRTSSWGAQASNDDVLRTLFHQTQTAQAYWNPGASKDEAVLNETYGPLVGYSRRMLGEMQDDPGVKWGRVIVTLFMGPEQLGMFMTFSALLLILGARALARTRRLAPYLIRDQELGIDEDSAQVVNDRSRWLIRWMLRSLPALGFIGTVRSLTLALSNADSIVRADGVIEQATAISNVSGTLAVAFTTTLIALVLGLVASLFNEFQVVRERRKIRRHWLGKATGSNG